MRTFLQIIAGVGLAGLFFAEGATLQASLIIKGVSIVIFLIAAGILERVYGKTEGRA